MGGLEHPDFVFISEGCKKFTFRICLWNWISETVCFRNNTTKIYILGREKESVCVCIVVWIWIQIQMYIETYIYRDIYIHIF